MRDLYRYLDTDGDGTGTKNAIGNYSGAVEEFFIAPPASTVFEIHRMIVSIEDSANPSADVYGNLAAALTNGVSIKIKDASGDLVDLCDGVTIKANSHWSRICYDVTNLNFGSGNDIVQVRWTFAKSGKPIYLDGDKGQYLSVDVNDDLTGLVSHYFMVQGVR